MSTYAKKHGRHSQHINSTKSIGVPSNSIWVPSRERSQIDPTKSIWVQEETISSHLNSIQRRNIKVHTHYLNLVERSMTHPSHGLSHTAYQISIWENDLENISWRCIHQNSLLAREVFSTRKSLSWKCSNFVLASILVKTFETFSLM